MEQTIDQTNKRAKRIFTVETALRNAHNSKTIINYDTFCIMICEQFTCSDRTAKEYIKIAKSRIKGWMGSIWEQKE